MMAQKNLAETNPGDEAAATARAQAFITELNKMHMLIAAQSLQGVKKDDTTPQHFSDEVEINDAPQSARWKVTHKDSLNHITDMYGAAVTAKGVYVAPGKQPPPGERRIYLLIEGPTWVAVQKARTEIKRIIDEETQRDLMRPERPTGRYSVL
eukprot:TRINITY_DN3160_c0_g2_i2.p3 TRINITY_DN3160_c0_g2~~TRINITY_DN3160_c0_g2_i2.p3  ORF type:complete len:153 (-),score=34.10 TRINITY_DN3160_c0_g2_i2:617-1075(-)